MGGDGSAGGGGLRRGRRGRRCRGGGAAARQRLAGLPGLLRVAPPRPPLPAVRRPRFSGSLERPTPSAARAGRTALPAPPGAAYAPAAQHQPPPRCAAVVHHGGSGTCAAAALAGVAQVVSPHMLDQFFWAVSARSRFARRRLLRRMRPHFALALALARALRGAACCASPQERMAYLGVAPEPVAAEVLQGSAGPRGGAPAAERLAAAVRFALGGPARAAAEELAQARGPRPFFLHRRLAICVFLALGASALDDSISIAPETCH